MSNVGVQADLVLDIDSALAAVSELEQAIQDAVSGVEADPVSIQVEADTAPAEAEIQSLDADPIDVEVDADTTSATSEIDNLGDSASAATGSVDGLSDATTGLSAGASALDGSIGGAVAGMGGFGKAAAAGGAALGVFFSQGIDATSQLERFNLVTGDAAASVRSIDVGGLSGDLGELALQLGSDDEAALNAAASLFQFGINSGRTADEVSKTTDQVFALAENAVALNPALGDISTVQDGLSRALARGGRFASQYGLSLTSAEINARALRDTGKSTATELTQFDKAAAGAAIATERLGTQLGDNVAAGAQNAAIQLKIVKQRASEAVEEIGKEIVPAALVAISVGADVAIGNLKTLSDGIGGAVEAAGDLGGGLEKLVNPNVSKSLKDTGIGISDISHAASLATNPVAQLFAAYRKLKDVFTDEPPGAKAFQFLGSEADKAAQHVAAFTDAAQSQIPAAVDVLQTVEQAGDAFGVLNAASDPETIIHNLDLQTFAIVTFQANLAKIAAGGFDEVINFLATAEPQVAAKLASVLADDPGELTRFEDSLKRREDAVTEFGSFLANEGAEAVGGGARRTGQAATDSFQNAWNKLPEEARSTLNRAGEQLTNEGILTASRAGRVGSDASGRFGAGLGTLIGRAGSIMRSSGSALSANAPIGTAAAAGTRVGAAFAQGIGEGIAANVGAGINAAVNAVHQAAAAATAAGEINSPSHLFAREVGAPIAEGIAFGITSGAADVNRAAASVVTGAAVASASGSVASASSLTGAGGGGTKIDVGGITIHLPEGTTPSEARQLGQAAGSGVLDVLAGKAAVLDARVRGLR